MAREENDDDTLAAVQSDIAGMGAVGLGMVAAWAIMRGFSA